MEDNLCFFDADDGSSVVINVKKRNKGFIIAVIVFLSLLSLTGCVRTVPHERVSDGSTMPPIHEVPDAPTGDSQEDYEYNAVLYIPAADALSLDTVSAWVTVTSGETLQEALVRELLAHINGSMFWNSNQSLGLAASAYPVEVMGDFVTVNLNTAARTLSMSGLFALRMAIVNTLTELPEVRYVCVLVNGRDAGLDIAITLPTGVLSRYPSGDIASFWRQIENQQNSDVQLQKMAALYFPSKDGQFLIGEVRNLTIASRTAGGYAKVLLEELAKGPIRLDCARTVVPPESFLQSDPLLLVPAGSSSKYIELYFEPGIDDFLKECGSSRGEMLSSICYTLTEFIPGLDGVVAYIDGELLIEAVLPGGDVWSAQNGQMMREVLAPSLGAVVSVYVPEQNENGLITCNCAIAQRYLTQPRALIRELMKEPDVPEGNRAIPAEITDADILGLQIRDHTVLLNLSEHFAAACSGFSDVEERNMIYAIVNTLTDRFNVNAVRFYVAGEQRQLAGYIDMRGEFLRHPGLIMR